MMLFSNAANLFALSFGIARDLPRSPFLLAKDIARRREGKLQSETGGALANGPGFPFFFGEFAAQH
ncbi:MAG: hypothetical protein ACLQF1_02815 [Methyloceanibacter sp.]